MKYAITHGFVMNNDGKLEWKDFLGRFPHVWALMTCAAYPLLRFVFAPILFGAAYFMDPTYPDASHNQLQYIYQCGIRKLYKTNFWISQWGPKLVNAFTSIYHTFLAYYGPDHPFTKLAENGKY